MPASSKQEDVPLLIVSAGDLLEEDLAGSERGVAETDCRSADDNFSFANPNTPIALKHPLSDTKQDSFQQNRASDV